MERFATPALVLGLASLVAGGVLWLRWPSWAAAWPAALILGGLLVLFALYASFGRWGGVFQRRTTRYGLNAVARKRRIPIDCPSDKQPKVVVIKRQRQDLYLVGHAGHTGDALHESLQVLLLERLADLAY
jgi:hypothetical protein